VWMKGISDSVAEKDYKNGEWTKKNGDYEL
jgi:hypothetical protein